MVQLLGLDKSYAQNIGFSMKRTQEFLKLNVIQNIYPKAEEQTSFKGIMFPPIKTYFVNINFKGYLESSFLRIMLSFRRRKVPDKYIS